MRYIRKHIITYLVFLIAVAAAILGIVLPGKLLDTQSEAEYGDVRKVPEEYYSASGTAIAKDASMKLDAYQRLQLITGQWESAVSEAFSYEMELESYEAVSRAREGITELYDLGLYPQNFSFAYGNWYTWEAVPCKAVDTIFGTYTAYYWCIRFVSYDESKSNLLYMLEDGTIFLALADMGEEYDFAGIKKIGDISLPEDAEVSKNEWDEEQLQAFLPFTDVDPAGFEEIDGLAVTQEDETYVILQKKSGGSYLLLILPEGNR